MRNAKATVPLPSIGPNKSYAPGTSERKELKAKLSELRGTQMEIPLIIGGKEIRTGRLGACILPHDHESAIGTYHMVGQREVDMAIHAASNPEGWKAPCAEGTVWDELKSIRFLALPSFPPSSSASTDKR